MSITQIQSANNVDSRQNKQLSNSKTFTPSQFESSMHTVAKPASTDQPVESQNEDMNRSWKVIYSYVTNREMGSDEYKNMKKNHEQYVKEKQRKAAHVAKEMASLQNGSKHENEELYLVTQQIKADHFEEKHFDAEPPCVDEENFTVKLIDKIEEFESHMGTKLRQQ